MTPTPDCVGSKQFALEGRCQLQMQLLWGWWHAVEANAKSPHQEAKCTFLQFDRCRHLWEGQYGLVRASTKHLGAVAKGCRFRSWRNRHASGLVDKPPFDRVRWVKSKWFLLDVIGYENIMTDSGVEIHIDQQAKDGSQSGVVICRGVERYVTELSLDCTEPTPVDTDVLSTGRLAAFVQWNAHKVTSSSSQHDDVHLLISESENSHQVLTKLATRCYPVSPTMSGLSHYDTLRDVQGAVAWGKAGYLIRSVPWWKKRMDRWVCMMKRSKQVQFDFSVHPRGKIQFLRALRGHSGGVRVGVQHCRTTCRFHTDGWFFYIPSDQFGIIGPLSTRVYLVEEKETGTTDMLLYSSRPISRVWRRSIIGQWKTSKVSIQNEMEKGPRCSLLVRYDHCTR